MRILYVEDEPDIRELACMALRNIAGHDVLDFGSSTEALDRVEMIGGLDLLLLDVMMPEMDGRALLQQLRRRPATAEVPAIFMTAKTMRDEVQELRQLGAIHVVRKPFDPLSLSTELDTAIAQAA